MLFRSTLLTYVKNIANGDATIILSAALFIKKLPGKPHRPQAVQNLLAFANNREGSIKLSWKKLPTARVYKIYISNAATPFEWKEFSGNIVTRSKTVIENLPAGQVKWFMIVAVNAAGEGGQSDPARVRVP